MTAERKRKLVEDKLAEEANSKRLAVLRRAFNVNMQCASHKRKLEEDVYFAGDLEAHLAIFRDKAEREETRKSKKNEVSKAKRLKLKDPSTTVPAPTPRADTYIHSIKLTRQNCTSTRGVFGNILFNTRTHAILCKHPTSFMDRHAHCPQCWIYCPYVTTCCTRKNNLCEVGKIMTEAQHRGRRAKLKFFKHKLDRGVEFNSRAVKSSITSRLEAILEDEKLRGRSGLELFVDRPKRNVIRTPLYLQLKAEFLTTNAVREERIRAHEEANLPLPPPAPELPEVPDIVKKPRISHDMIKDKQAQIDARIKSLQDQEDEIALHSFNLQTNLTNLPPLPAPFEDADDKSSIPLIYSNVLGTLTAPPIHFNPPTMHIKREILSSATITVSNSDCSDPDGKKTPPGLINPKRIASILNLPRTPKPTKKVKNDKIPRYVHNNSCSTLKQARRERRPFFPYPEAWTKQRLSTERFEYHREVTASMRERMGASLNLEVNNCLAQLESEMRNEDTGYRPPGQPKLPEMIALDTSLYDTFTGQFRIESLRFPQRYWTKEPIRLTDRVDISQADICYLEQLALTSALSSARQHIHITKLRKSLVDNSNLTIPEKDAMLKTVNFLAQAQGQCQKVSVEMFAYITFVRRRQALMGSGMSREEAIQNLTAALRPGERFLFPQG